MRIVHLVIGADLAGGQKVALQLARAARDRGDAVSFVAPEGGSFVDAARAEGFPVAVVDVRRTLRVGGVARLVRHLRRERADVLHTHALSAANTLSRVAARLAHVPVISHLHIENHFRPATARALRALDNATARLCAALVAVSEDTKRAYERQGYPRGRIEVVYNGVELPPNSVPARNDTPLIGEIARLCDVKGQRELIAALAELPDARLVLAGVDLEQGGAFQIELEREAEQLSVRERVEFAGFHHDVPALLDELDIVALPSWTEGLPLTVLEAMAHARPVVATSVGGTPEVVVDGETGLLVPPRDSTALAAAIRRLLDDRELAQRLGDAGRRRVEEHFSLAAMNERILALYDEVAE
jgi:glycosyltransferase involved in cell wall biosynthesis